MTKSAVLGGALILAICAACGGARVILKSPLEDQCTSTGLRGCGELTEGVLLYVEGKQLEARTKLAKAGAANSREEIEALAEALETLDMVPGAAAHTAQIRGALALLLENAPSGAPVAEPRAQPDAEPARRAKPPPEQQPAPKEVAVRSQRLVTADTDARQTRGGSVSLDGSEPMTACNALVAAEGLCTTVEDGPLFVTDLRSQGAACPAFAAAVPMAEGPAWVLASPLEMHGGRLLVNDGARLVIGVTGDAEPGCSVPWSGFQPYPDRDPEQLDDMTDGDDGFEEAFKEVVGE